MHEYITMNGWTGTFCSIYKYNKEKKEEINLLKLKK